MERCSEAEESRFFCHVREFYLREEPAIIAAIRRGDPAAAIEAINRVLVQVYARGNQSTDQLKGLLLEIVVMMSRAAVEAGASQTEIFGNGYRLLMQLAKVQEEEEVAAWLRTAFLRIFSAGRATRQEIPDPIAAGVVKILREECGEPLTRTAIARRLGVSPARLARTLKKSFDRSFSELLREYRLQRACDLLEQTDEKLATIAALCGFSDQSHLTRSFHAAKGITPGEFRTQLRKREQGRPLTPVQPAG